MSNAVGSDSTRPLGRRGEATRRRLLDAVEGLLAEGSLRELQSRLYKIDLEDSFGLLLKTAASDVIGCVTVEPVSGE